MKREGERGRDSEGREEEGEEEREGGEGGREREGGMNVAGIIFHFSRRVWT